jgi:TPR repeat protein
MQSHYTKLLRATLTALLMLVAMAGAAIAGPLEDTVAASERHDYRTALRLFRLLAEQGNAIAQSALGYMLETGEGVQQDYSEAAKWYRLAGEQGDALAQTRLGFMYEMGKGGSQNFAEAAKWLRLAAEQGRVAAQDSLGGLYVSGRGVPKDYVVAYMWLSLSAAQGDHDAAIQRDLVAKLITPAQIAEAQKLARGWKPKP